MSTDEFDRSTEADAADLTEQLTEADGTVEPDGLVDDRPDAVVDAGSHWDADEADVLEQDRPVPVDQTDEGSAPA